MSYKYFQVEKQKGYALITLDKPSGNTLSLAVLSELLDILDEVENDDSVRALLMAGAGEEVFSTGVDLVELSDIFITKTVEEKAKAETRLNTWADRGMKLCNRIEGYPKPFILAINGLCIGGALELATCFHILLAADTARLGLPMLRFGVIPLWGACIRLSRIVGRLKAHEMLLAGELISAQEAERLGLVNRVVPKEKLIAEAKSLAEKLGKGSPIAMRGVIDALRKSLSLPWDEALNTEKEIGKNIVRSENAAIGYKVYLKRLRVILESNNFSSGIINFWDGLEPKFN